MRENERHYGVLAPLMALAGIFIDPYATTLIPLILFFIYHWKKMDFARLVALRVVDLAFSIQLFLILGSLLLGVYMTFYPLPTEQAREMVTNITVVVVIYLVVSFILLAIFAWQGKSMNNVLSLKIAERIMSGSKNVNK